MKNLYAYVSVLAIVGFLFLNPNMQLWGQAAPPDFNSPAYEPAIENIVNHNDGFQTSTAVIEALTNPVAETPALQSGFRGDTIITNPVIAFIPYNQQSVTFKYIPTAAIDTVTVGIPINGVDWLSDPVVDLNDSTLTIAVSQNTGYTPNEATFDVTAEFSGGTSATCQATVLQGAAPEPFILVSPKYLAISGEGGITPPFTVNKFYVAEWEAVIDANWITIETQTPDTITFSVDPNISGEDQAATIFIQDSDNPDIRDSLTIFQFMNTAGYIFTDPQTSNVGPESGSITLDVHANIEWEYVPVENPGDMLTEVAGGQDTITFTIAGNTTTMSRKAIGRIKAVGANSPSDTFYIIQDAAYILLNPKEKLVPCEGETFVTDITRYNVDNIVADTSGFLWDVTFFDSDSLQIVVSANENSFPVSDTLIVYSATNSDIRDTLTIFQYACNQPYIVVSPKFQSLPYQGGTTGSYQISSSLVDVWEVYFETPPTWITETIIDGNELKFVANPNDSGTYQQVTFQVRSVSDHTIFDTAVIFLEAPPEPVLIASPRTQVISHTGNDSVDFRITYENITGWELDPDNTIPSWIVIDSAGGNLLSLDIVENATTASRESQLVILASNDVLIRDTVYIYQYSATEKYILAAPRERIIAATGIDSAGFNVTTANVENWLVDSAAFPQWIMLNHKNNSSFSLTINPNQEAGSLSATIKIYDSTDNSIYDSVHIFQYQGEEPVILVSPREQIAFQSGGETAPFSVETTGPVSWSVTLKPNWIQILEQGESILRVEVDPNPNLETRIGTIYVGDPDIPGVIDSVKIYQFSTLDAYLLAHPRLKSFGQAGTESTTFEITKANVLNWETAEELLPAWIQVNEDGGDILDLEILENPTNVTRHDSVFIVSDDNNGAADTILIYQFAASDTVLIASPRQQISAFGGETLDFEVTVQNAEAWKADPGTVPEWINVVSQGGSLLSLATQPNLTSSTRFTTINIFDTLNPDISDLVSVYQYAAPESYILAAPRSDTVQFFGDNLATFEITTFNLSGDLTVDENTVPAWITAAVNDNQLQLDVSPNPLSETRNTLIFLFDSGNTEIRDSIAIYQYAQPEQYILGAPREQRTGYEGGNLLYEITTANIENWIVDESTLPEWITGYEITPISLLIEVSENTSSETNSAAIRIFNPANPAVEDSVQVYQYSGLDYYILAEPREQQTANPADTLSFGITTVNLAAPWQTTFIAGAEYAEIISTGDTLLKVAVSENTDSTTHLIKIRLYSELHPSAADTVSIYQYSPFEPFIIIDPTYVLFRSGKDSLSIHTFSNMESYAILISPDEPQPPDTTWYQISKYSGSLNDSVKLSVSFNPESYKGRSSYLTFLSPDSSFVNYFHFQQRKNSFNFVSISGAITLNDGGETPLDSVAIIIDQDTLLTNQEGIFMKDNVNYGWVGVVKPEKTGYFFDPANRVFNNALEQDTVLNFTAIEIDPKIEFNIEGDSLSICPGEQVDLSSPEYPTISVTGTYGERSYKWFSTPEDPNLITDSTSTPAYQIFKPATTTTYYLVLYNNATSDTAHFTIKVNPLPANRDFEGPTEVCNNQAGAIYSVVDFEPGENFQWELSQNGSVIRNYSSNIATINWNTGPGTYTLILYTINSSGCHNTRSKTIVVSNDEAPAESTVTKKSGDNMLVCSTTNPEDFNFEWGWYEMANGNLGEKYIIPGKSEWYCRLPEDHIFDPIQYTYFVQITYKNSASCQTISFLNDNAPVQIPELSGKPFAIFPNPTSGSVWLRFNTNIEQQVIIQIRDTKGLLVAEDVLLPGLKKQIVSIETVKNLRKGIYLVELQVGDSRYNSKIVVQ